MKRISYFSMMAAVWCVQVELHAQSDSLKQDIQFKAGVYYISHLHYYGRTDSLQSSGVFPMAELWFNGKFYINAAPVFVNNAVQNFQYAGTVTTVGYQFNNPESWSGNFYFVKPFYQKNIQLVQSALKAQLAGSLTAHTNMLNITGGADIKLSNRMDFGAMVAADHIFRMEFPHSIILVVDPAAALNAGTQQFVHTYYKKTDFILFPGPAQEITENVKKFNILSYELSMPVILAKGKFQFLAIPSYVIPENLVAVPGRPDLSERGKNLFYATLGIKMIF